MTGKRKKIIYNRAPRTRLRRRVTATPTRLSGAKHRHFVVPLAHLRKRSHLSFSWSRGDIFTCRCARRRTTRILVLVHHWLT